MYIYYIDASVNVPQLISDSGMVLNAAVAAFILFIKSHSSSIFRDGSRLVLTTFLVSSALWAQAYFVAVSISLDSPTPCLIATSFASVFDHLSRVTLQQGLVWVVDKYAAKSPVQTMVAQGLVFLRFLLGAVAVGFQRPRPNTVCVVTPSVLPLGIVVLAVDACLVAILLARMASSGLRNDASKQNTGPDHGHKVLLLVIGSGVWTAVSVV